MSQISSINFKKSKDFQVFHNSTIRPNYAIGDELSYTLTGKQALNLKNQIIENAKEAYTKHTGQRFKATSYEWSAVVNIKPDSTMQDLEKLANHFQNKYGFQCYQIAIHRDEGHIDENGNKVINHHAHMEFVTLDKNTGKSLFRADLQRPKALRQMQNEVAEILQMQRGIDKRISKRERIEPRKYAQMKENEKENIKALKDELAEKESEIKENYISKKDLKQKIEQERKAWIAEQGHTKEEYAELRALNDKNYKTIQELENAIQELKSKLAEKEKENKEQKEALNNEKSKTSTLTSRINDFNQKQGDIIPKKEFDDLKANYDANLIENENLKAKVDLLENFITPIVASNLENCQNNIENNKFNAENNTKGQARCDCVNEVIKNNETMKELMEKFSFCERYFSFEPFKELYEKTKEWIAEKCRKWDLTRDRGMSR